MVMPGEKRPDNPMEQLAVVRQKLQEVCEEIGLGLMQIAFVPNEDPNGAHFVQAILSLDPDVAFKDSEQRSVDAEFEMITRMARAEEENDKIEGIKNSGIDLLKGLEGLGAKDGIGLDDDPNDEDNDGPTPQPA